MYEERILLYCTLGLEWLIILAIFRLIWSYLNHKPLGKSRTDVKNKHKNCTTFDIEIGMQTLFDQMTKDLILASLGSAITASLSNSKYWSMNYFVAIAIIWAQYFAGILFLGQLLSTFVTRYIIIYHPSTINDVEETKIMVISR